MAKLKRRNKEEAKTNGEKYNRADLISILQKVKPALASKTMLEEFSNFIFTGSHLLTTNDRICICYPLKTRFKCSIPSSEFYNILSSLKEENISIEQKEEKLLFKTDKTSAELSIKKIDDVVNDFIEAIGVNDFFSEDFKSLSKDFIEGLTSCMFTASKDISQPLLTCLYASGKEIISSDDYRISLFTTDKALKDKFLIPASSVQEMIKFKEIESYFRNDSWIYFLTKNGVIFCSRIINEVFPDIKKEFDFEANEIILPKDFEELVANASILASGEFDIDKKIEVKVNKGKVSCKGQNDLGWIESKSDINTKQNFSFSINPIFLSQILKKTNIMKLGEGRILFETEKFKHLISLYIEE